MMRITRTGPRAEVIGGSSGRLVGNEHFVMRTDLADASNLYGWPGFSVEAGASLADVSMVRSASGGPANRPYVRYGLNRNAEFGLQWGRQNNNGTAYGQSVFWRFSFRNIFSAASHTQKIIIIYPGFNDRPIMVIQGNWGSGWVFRLCRNGGLDLQDDGGSWQNGGWVGGSSFNSDNTWYNVQVELRYPSNSSASDGYWKIWRNNDDYNNPTAQTPAVIPFRTSGSTDTLDFSGYHQGSSYSSRVYDVADFRLGPTFDSSWHASGS